MGEVFTTLGWVLRAGVSLHVLLLLLPSLPKRCDLFLFLGDLGQKRLLIRRMRSAS